MAKAPKITIPSSKVNIALAAGTTAAAMKSAEATAGKLYFVPRASIRQIPGFNVRVDSPDYRAHRDMIGASIEQNGYDESKPLAGYVAKEGDENVIYVTDGHTRLDAVNALAARDENPIDIAKLPVIVRATAPSLHELTVALHTNNTGRPLSPFELGVVVKRLMKEDGADKAKIATSLSVTPRYLDDVLLLVNSPKGVREAVLEGAVSSTMAIQTLRKAGDEPKKAEEQIVAAVAKAKASGKGKATAKDVGPKMMKVKHSVSVAEGTDMKEIVKAVAAKVRETVNATADGDGDETIKLAAVDGTITILIEVPKPADPVKAAAEKKEAPAKKPAAKKEGAKPADKKPTAKKAKPAAAPAEKKEEPAATDADDLGIPGAEATSDEGQDDEVAIMPPAVKNGEGVPDEEVDI